MQQPRAVGSGRVKHARVSRRGGAVVRVAVDQSPERTIVAVILGVFLIPAAVVLIPQIEHIRDGVKRPLGWVMVVAMFGLPIWIWLSRRRIVVDADARVVTLGSNSTIGFDELAGVTVESEERTMSNPNGGTVTATIWKAVLQRADGRIARVRRAGLTGVLFGTGQKSSIFEHAHATRVVAVARVVGEALAQPVVVAGEDLSSDYRSRLLHRSAAPLRDPPKQLAAVEVDGGVLSATWRVSELAVILIVGVMILGFGATALLVPIMAGEPFMWELALPVVALTGLSLLGAVRVSDHGRYRLTADGDGLTYRPARGKSRTTRLDDIELLLATDSGLAVITAETQYVVRLAKGNARWLEQRIEAHWSTTG